MRTRSKLPPCPWCGKKTLGGHLSHAEFWAEYRQCRRCGAIIYTGAEDSLCEVAVPGDRLQWKDMKPSVRAEIMRPKP